jgi:hypothetical protein
MVLVEIVENIVCDIPAYFGRCMNCGWQDKPHSNQHIAVNVANRHVCKKGK